MLFVMTALENAVVSAVVMPVSPTGSTAPRNSLGDEPERGAGIGQRPRRGEHRGHEQQRDRQQQRRRALAHAHPVRAPEERPQRPAPRLLGVDDLPRAGDERLQARDDRIAGMARGARARGRPPRRDTARRAAGRPATPPAPAALGAQQLVELAPVALSLGDETVYVHAVQYEDRITIPTPEGVSLELTLAGLGSRAISGLIDLVFKALLLGCLLVVLLADPRRERGVRDRAGDRARDARSTTSASRPSAAGARPASA